MTVGIIPVGMLGTNCYIIKTDGESCAVVDPGAQPERIIRELEELRAVPRMILLTHGHHDHIGGVKKLMARYPDAVLYIGKGDAEMLGDTQKSLAVFRNSDDSDFVIGNARTLADGDVLQLEELEIRVLETPGHTKGGVTYLCEDAMFAGDTLFYGDVGRTDLYGGDYTTLLRSLRKLAEVEGDYRVYPGHGDSTTLQFERQNNSYIQEALKGR
ncbi:MBL fold metallo-hydrolase [Ruminococcaceae bacterium OttesenSCG-928-L11]|nr:MBL fold metallo-hydrolase [Ruminococcaceae bacterium OttesenSCG-928-L11]